MKKVKNVKYVYCLMLCVLLFFTACGKEGIPDNDVMPGESAAPGITYNKQEREWVYVPEVFMVGDEHADYERMQPTGGTFCYVSTGERLRTVREVSVGILWPKGS